MMVAAEEKKDDDAVTMTTSLLLWAAVIIRKEIPSHFPPHADENSLFMPRLERRMVVPTSSHPKPLRMKAILLARIAQGLLPRFF